MIFGVVVTGGRHYAERENVDRVLRLFADLTDDLTVYVGDCPTGTDLFTWEWCQANRVACVVETANWDLHGSAAGPLRNQKLIYHRPDVVIAFPGGRGTLDCTSRARRAGIPVFNVAPIRHRLDAARQVSLFS